MAIPTDVGLGKENTLPVYKIDFELSAEYKRLTQIKA